MPNFSQELFNDICKQLEDGKSLRAICKQKGMPNKSTFSRWLDGSTDLGITDLERQALCDQYARACEDGIEILADEILEIADDTSKDTITTEGGNETANHEWIARSRLMVDARKWLLSKRLPKKYGDKTAVDVTSGGDKITWNEVRTYDKPESE